ncbi:glutathione S-transferase family protein [Ottowia testudinis]|uniref:Glutathione S-transferase n=1 Tax=Ottowia testudinis TaxID=2816950 RepID=A0A975H363_9BURK|nr:glutathione S-transferase [Ottowia testudinis]QTD44911.1 glutathione S-transferase [Ottowia testudinis]
MIRLWGRLSSINVRKVAWTLQETGVPFERIDAGLSYGVVDSDAYGAKNPNRLVPLLEDGDFVLWESNAIVRYLCARYAPALYPHELRARFDAERWMDWQQTTLNRAGGPAFVQLVRTPAEQRDPGVIDASRAAMAPLIAMLDAHLVTRPWMGGDAFSMADIPVACDIHRWWNLPQPAPEAPHVQRWFSAILARPATRGVLDLPLA